MKTALAFTLLSLSAIGVLAEPEAAELVAEKPASAWRFSAGYRAAPGIKSSASVDARAAAAAAAAVLRPAGHGGSSRSTSTESLGSTYTGTTEAAALARSGYIQGQTRYEFDNGYVDFDDGSGHEGDTMNWHFDSTDAFSGGVISAERAYGGTTVTRTRTTESETTRSASFREAYAGDISDSATESANGIELRLDRTLWRNDRFGVDFGAGWTWYDDVDAFSAAGRAYSGSSSASASSRSAVTDTEVSTTEAGAVATLFSAPEFTDLDDIRNDDGTIGGAYVEGGALTPGYQTPVLTVSPDRFSTETRRDPVATETTAIPGGTTTTSSSRSASRTVDVRSEGTLSLQELRLGVQPFWRAAERLSLRADLGLLAVYSEMETETRLAVDGAPAAALRKEDDDWTFGGYAGLSLGIALTDRIELYLGAEARFPNHKIRFDDGVVSGEVELAKWSASTGLAFRF